ncbi:hypothetical protein K502DRAFT_362574 [Neoconidiobolus thromboides FSU 785]|nr:hypothetical protein K502DRAFT_362574 [Neoconidiobolus thromboides FSU 785]
MVIDILKIEEEIEPQVFESTDVVVPQFRPYKVVEDKQLPEIDRSELNSKKNLKFFKTKVGDGHPKFTKEKKFNYSFYNKHKDISNDAIEIESDDEIDDTIETPNERLKRIIMEVQELEQDMNKENKLIDETSGTSAISMLNNLVSIQRQLNMKSKDGGAKVMTSTGTQLLDRLNKAYFNNEAKEFLPPSYEQQVNHALELEARVTSLEALLGPETLVKADLPNGLSLTRMIEDMQQMLRKIKDQNHLDDINKSIKNLIAELDRLITLKSSFKQSTLDKIVFSDTNLDSETKNKVDKMYKLYEKFDIYISNAPKIAQRLKIVSAMHQKLADFDNVLDNMENIINQVTAVQENMNTRELIEKFKKIQEEVNSRLQTMDQSLNSIIDTTSNL